VFVLRAIQGLFAGYGAIAMTMAAESAPPEHVAAAIGWVQTAQRLGPALGPAIGGALAAALGLRKAFLVSASFYLVAFLLVVFAYRERMGRPVGQTESAAPDPSFATFRAVPHFTLFMATIFGLQLVDRSFGPVLPLYLLEIGVTEPRVPFLSGVLFTTTAIAAALGNQTSTLLLRKQPVASLMPAMALVGAFAAAVFGAAPPMSLLIVTAVVFGYGIGVATTSIYTAATHAVPPVTRGVAFGYLTTAYLIGLAVSPVVAGLVGAFSMRAVFFCDAAGLAVLAWVVRERMTSEK
jgi:DHA1 family multidrug resistance protein-like MFS transporter